MRSSEIAFFCLVGAVAIARLAELRLAAANRRRALERGGVESGQGHYPWMVLLHALFLVAAPLEVVWLERPWRLGLGVAMLAVLAGAMALRYAAIRALGRRWTTRIVVVPGERPVASGPYRYLRHPNYLAVCLEFLALPLVHGAWWTALAFSAANAELLRRRIRAEERALGALDAERFASTPRFLPGER
jgi:methyltransferase